MKYLKQSVILVLWLAFLTGIVYPMLITGIAYSLMREKAEGSILLKKGKPVGSVLIAQKFTSDKYFWPRPSSIDFNPLPSGGSNLGPTSKTLQQQVKERKAALAKSMPSIPPELLFASGSGLDPHIDPYTAFLQAERIAKARGIDKIKVENLIRAHTKSPVLRLFGHPTVNVLLLNLALDDIK